MKMDKCVFENFLIVILCLQIQLNAVQGSGKYIDTACFTEYVYQKLNKREQLYEQVKN